MTVPTRTLKRAGAIMGVSHTKLGVVPGVTAMDLNAEAAVAAVADAGLRMEDVDGLMVFGSRADDHMRYQALAAEHLGLPKKRFTDVTKTGGASSASAVRTATALVATGQCENVLIVFGDNIASGVDHEQMLRTYADHHHHDFEVPYGPLIISLYALVAQRMMLEYGWTSRDLAAAAVSARAFGALNPAAQFRAPITIDDVLASRMITSPLHLLDCAPISDGAAAVLVGRPEDAEAAPHPAVYVEGAASMFSYYYIHDLPNYTDYLLGMARQSADECFSMAGMERSDVDVVFLGDPTTICVLANLVGTGFSTTADVGELIGSGAIGPRGVMPVNTHGGNLACAHPGTPGQLLHIVEATQQLRGEAGGRQIPDAHVAFVHGQAGVFTSHCSLLLSSN
jgi:acetyl-CoA acetyltransferase